MTARRPSCKGHVAPNGLCSEPGDRDAAMGWLVPHASKFLDGFRPHFTYPETAANKSVSMQELTAIHSKFQLGYLLHRPGVLYM